MFFSIDSTSDVAIYDQIVRQVKFAIADGVLSPGDTLPTARPLSQELAINPNTILKAYQILQLEGIVELNRGKGLVVTAQATRHCESDRKALVTDRIRETLREAVQSGLTEHEIKQIVSKELSKFVKKAHSKSN